MHAEQVDEHLKLMVDKGASDFSIEYPRFNIAW